MGYKNNILDTNNYSDYTFVYNINNDDKDFDFVLRYIGNDRTIKLSPEVLY